METVKIFRGDFGFLSNFWGAPLVYQGIRYPTSEHAYQAQKLGSDPKFNILKMAIATVETPGKVKRMSRTLKIRPDWEEVKVQIMREIVFEKFAQNPQLAGKLLATGDVRLEEGNGWGDTFWGIHKGQGKNWLGRILMETRDQLRQKHAA